MEMPKVLKGQYALIILLDKDKTGLKKVAEQFKAMNYLCYCLDWKYRLSLHATC